MPAPENPRQSLFIFYLESGIAENRESTEISGLTLEGGDGSTIEIEGSLSGDDDGKAVYLDLSAGPYTLRGLQGPPVSFDLPAESVFLFQKKAVPGRDGPVLRDLKPEDRKWVSEDCADIIEFTKWYGRSFVGFGPFTPRYTLQKARYEYRIESTPAGADVIIDDQNWGSTPLTAELETGKHLLRLEKAGFAPVQTFVDVEGAGKLTLELSRIEGLESAEEETDQAFSQDRYTLLVTPFANTGDESQDNLETVFSDGIASGLYKRENIRVLRLERGELKNEGEASAFGKVGLDLSLASAKGAELLVSGAYNADEELFVHAALYDVRTGQVKTSTMYTGEAGLAMFDSIDEMTEEFLENVDRVLPAVGREVIEQEQTVSQEVISYQKKLTVKQIAANRNARRHALSVSVNYSGSFDTVYAQSGDPEDEMSRGDVSLGASLLYDYHIFDPMQLTALFLVRFQEFNGDSPVELEDTGTNDYLLAVGPRISFPGRSVDVYMGMMAHGTYGDAFDFYEWDITSVIKRGPYISAGLTLDTGMRTYFQERFSDVPWFMDFGMAFDPISVQFDIGGNEPIDYIFMTGKFYAGFGRRF
ncbi:MAG: PEGA domain-containing protein [Spirochaetales bacterium]|nr:PEGA domain-containing protein [Spirochaetales bacterium]MCF7937347.1 PEGA domain-containing protein [Spirochaetales bacterium]